MFGFKKSEGFGMWVVGMSKPSIERGLHLDETLRKYFKRSQRWSFFVSIRLLS
jgi:hypothetical protein